MMIGDVDNKRIEFRANCELARIRFCNYCNLIAPEFYKKDRLYLKELCDRLQSFIESDKKIMIVNLPPRHGKSRTLTLLVAWILGNDQTKKIMTGSYNETLSTVFSKSVRNMINEEKADVLKPVFNDIFPGIHIKKGDGAMNLWSLENGYNNYLATSPNGTATGFGANLMIIDDLIKNAQEAHNANIKEEHWKWFTETMLSRLEEGGKIILVMTRWSKDDLAGRVLDFYKKQNVDVEHIVMPALKEDGTMLCSSILSLESYNQKIKAMGEDIALANYQQQTIDLKGVLYTEFKTYNKLPLDDNGNSLFEGIYSYTDTADAGKDYLCSIIFGVYQKEAYILDIYYTQASMEITEKEVSKRHKEFNVNKARIESNNGGSGFARNVKRISREELNNIVTVFTWFHQSKNKQARILSNASWIQQHVYFPNNLRDKNPDFYRDMISYQKEGKNMHDDAQDAVTGVAETMYMLGS